MSKADESRTLLALQAANQCGVRYWHLPRYDRETDQLVLRSLGSIAKRSWESHKGFWPSLWRRLTLVDDYAYLAFYSPRYVRLGHPFGLPELATGARLEAMRTSLPAGILLDDRLVIVEASDGAESCVVCESVGFYRTDWRECWITRSQRDVQILPPFTTTRKSRPYDGSGHESAKPFRQNSYLDEIEGATLALWGFPDASGGALILLATGLTGKPRALRFSILRYVDCPTTMHRVKLRLATAEESEALGRRLHESPQWLDGRHVIVECDEGMASIVASYLHLSWRKPSKDLWTLRAADRVPDPSWRIGPPEAEWCERLPKDG